MSDDPRLRLEKELITEVIAAGMAGDIESATEALDSLTEVQADTLPDEGKGRIRFAGRPEITEPVSATCPDCQAQLYSPGGGVRFGDLGMTEAEFLIELHHSGIDEPCPALKWRWWRWRANRSPWARVARKWMSWCWRHHGSIWAQLTYTVQRNYKDLITHGRYSEEMKKLRKELGYEE